MAYALIWNRTVSGLAISPAAFAAGDRRKARPSDNKVLLEYSRKLDGSFRPVGVCVFQVSRHDLGIIGEGDLRFYKIRMPNFFPLV